MTRRKLILDRASFRVEPGNSLGILAPNKPVRYLSLSAAPVAPHEATYPKTLRNTLLAFPIFSGIYLMLSLTASILREQVST